MNEIPLVLPVFLLLVLVLVLVGGIAIFRVLVGAVQPIATRIKNPKAASILKGSVKAFPILGIGLLAVGVGTLISLECGWTNLNCSGARDTAPLWMLFASLTVSVPISNRLAQAIWPDERFS